MHKVSRRLQILDIFVGQSIAHRREIVGDTSEALDMQNAAATEVLNTIFSSIMLSKTFSEVRTEFPIVGEGHTHLSPKYRLKPTRGRYYIDSLRLRMQKHVD